MALYKFHDYYPNARETFGDSEMINLDSYSLYTEGDNKIGSIDDILVDQSGRFRYLVVDTGPWIFGKKVLVPVGLAQFDYQRERAYVNGLTKNQVENLPEYHRDMTIDEAYENRVRETYRPLAEGRSDRQFLGHTYADTRQTTASTNTTVGQYDYDREPHYYGMSERENHQQLRLYEERLVTSKQRQKAGEVAIGKHVETETARASVPVDKERVVIERNQPSTTRPAGANETPDFREGEVARMEVYEETANIGKQAFVREEVNVRKEVEHDTVDAQEKIRREELDIKKKGNPNIDNAKKR